MLRLYDGQFRHSEHYLKLLKALGDRFVQGKDALKSAIAEYESESGNIEVGYAWAARNSAEDLQAANLCVAYPNAAPYLLDFQQQPLERIRWLEASLTASRRLKEHDAENKQLLSIGVAYLRLGDIKNASDSLELALAMSRDIGDRDLEGEILSHLGRACIDSGQVERALSVLEQALLIARAVANLRAQCLALNSLGQVHYTLREFQRAIEYYTASLHIANEEGYLPEESITLVNLGKTYSILNRPRKAIATQHRSLVIAREIHDKRSEVKALASLGQAYYLLGEFKEAITFLEWALPFARQLGDGLAEAEILSTLGDSHLEEDQVDLAIDFYKQRTAITRTLGHNRILAIEHILFTEPSYSSRPESEDSTIQVVKNSKTQASVLVEDFEKVSSASAPLGCGTVTWLHLSDLHFQQSSAYDANVVLEPLLEDIARLKTDEGLCPDFAAITGDIAFSGKPEEYALAYEFIEKLSRVTGLSREHLFMVPGNHDINMSLIEPSTQSLGNTITDRKKYGQLCESPQLWKLVLKRFEGWSQFFNDHFDGELTFDDDNYYYAKTLDLTGTRVAILGLNSAWLSHPEADDAHGLVLGERQVRAALETAKKDSAQIKIALMHHPCELLRQFDQNDSAELLLDKCNFMLHGHLHRPSTAWLSTPDSYATVIAGGACYATREYLNSYNFVKLDLKTNTGVIYFRSYSDRGGGFWAPDTRLYKNASNGRHKFVLPDFGKP